MTATALFNDNQGLAHYILRVRFPLLAHDDDARQEALLGLWRAAKTYKPEVGPFKTYAGICIKNAIRQYRRDEVPKWQGYSYLSEPANADPELEDITIGDELQEPRDYIADCITRADIGRLPDKQRRVMALRRYGMSQPEIARSTGLSQPHVSRLLARGVKAVTA